MKKFQFIQFLKKPRFILVLILAIFFLKGTFLTTLFPIFTGQDEARHYSAIQYLAEPKDKPWEKIDRPLMSIQSINVSDYNFSEEMMRVGEASDFDVYRHQLWNTVNFTEGYNGAKEATIDNSQWEPYNYFIQPDALVGRTSLYHKIGAWIEKVLQAQDTNMLVRFFFSRIFSTILGTIGILLAYLIFKNIGIKEKESLILTAIVAFQPKYAMYLAIINYDVLLIPLFFLFTLGAILSLRQGPNWKNILIMLLAIVLGSYVIVTFIILIPPFIILMVYFFYQHFRKNINSKTILFAILIFLLLFCYLYYNFLNLIPFRGNLFEAMPSLSAYLSKSLTLGRFGLSSRTYWGSLGWFNSFVENNFTNIVYFIQAFSVIGLGIFFFSKKKFEYLPEKKYVIFLIGMIVALQFGIRIADWRMFIFTGSLDLGTPGRYFLPNLVSHIALVFIGLGALLRKEKYFRNAMLGGLILMISFSLYLIFNVVLPRYYL